MRARLSGFLIAFLFLAPITLADTVILHDGSSYSGRLTGITQIPFTDTSGVQYNFPEADVQTIVFTPAGDTVTLRNGKVYSGQYNGPAPMSFRDAQGISYEFPLKDLESVVFSRSNPVSHIESGRALVIPEGTEVTIRTDESINSDKSSPGQLYAATIAEGVPDATGAIAIPQGSEARLVVRNITTGGAVHSPELVLDLFSVTVNGKEHRVVTSNVDVSSKRGVGKNRRTAESAGGGAGLGALVGAIFGGGKGAAIGAASGAGGGLLTQIFTRGKRVEVPVESKLIFRLDRTLVLRPNS